MIHGGDSCSRKHAARRAEAEARAQVDGREVTKYAPAPLSTLELQKRATQALRMSGETIMGHAEALYQRGLISYPRTETDQFDPQQPLMARAASHLAGAGGVCVQDTRAAAACRGRCSPRTASPSSRSHRVLSALSTNVPTPSLLVSFQVATWLVASSRLRVQPICMELAEGDAQAGANGYGWAAHAQLIAAHPHAMWRQPQGGGHNDNAHPPIHPTTYAAPGALSPPEKRVYEFICRAFLACAAAATAQRPHCRPASLLANKMHGKAASSPPAVYLQTALN